SRAVLSCPTRRSSDLLYWAGGEPRGMLRAVVDVDGSPLTVYVTHLGLDARERDGQRRQIVDRLRGTDGPFVLLGDMNESWSPGRSEEHTSELQSREKL